MKFDSGCDLLRKVPFVRRTRGYRLYLNDGRRLIDLWLNGGTALLGHTPPNILRELKNTAGRGLYAPYPHFTEDRLYKALKKLLPGYSFRVYASAPFTADIGSSRVKWRPFTNTAAPLMELILPVPLNLCVIAAKTENHLKNLPPGDILPPLTLVTAARGIHDLLVCPERAKPNFPRTIKALKENNCLWQRDGIYLYLKENSSQNEWQELFNKFLKEGFLLPPAPEYPVILPGEMSDGEDAKLARLLI